MAFNTSDGRATYTALSAQTDFTFTFKVFTNADIKVYQTPIGSTPNDTTDLLTITTDYTVSINGDNGGTVTLVSGATTGDTITLVRDLDVKRDVDYQDNGDLLAGTLDSDQNYQTYLIQQSKSTLERTIRLQDTTIASAIIPAPQSGYLFRWNIAGDGIDAIDPYSLLDVPTAVMIGTIANLRLTPYVGQQIVSVTGYYTALDNIVVREYYWDATSTEVDNGGTIIAVTGVTTGRWKMKYSGAVNVKWFGAKGDGVTNDTTSFNNAQNISTHLIMPDGIFVLIGFRAKNKLNLIGSGYEATKIKQGSTSDYAINCLSDSTVGQLLGLNLAQFSIIGATSATVHALNVEANASYAITHSSFDIKAYNTYAPLRINCVTANNVYNCKFKITSDVSQAGIISMGAYNIYDFFITNVANGGYINDTSASAVFTKIVTEGAIYFNGYNNVIKQCTIENFITNDASTGAAIRISGSSNSFDNIFLINVPVSKTTIGVDIYGQFINIRSLLFAGTGYPTYQIALSSSSSGNIENANKLNSVYLEDYIDGATLRRWTFGGEVQILRATTARRGMSFAFSESPASGSTINFGASASAGNFIDTLIVKIPSTIASLTIALPTSPINGQTANISFPVAGVTSITLTAGTGKFIIGALSSAGATSNITFVYRSFDSTWYKV